jgi:hypothetical protein
VVHPPLQCVSNPAKLLSRRLPRRSLFQSCPESIVLLYNLQFVCCRPLLPGVSDDDRFLGGAHRFCDSMVNLCGCTA